MRSSGVKSESTRFTMYSVVVEFAVPAYLRLLHYLAIVR